MAEKVALSGQSLFDMAILLEGSVEAAFDIALENGMSLTDEIPPGRRVKYSGAAVSPQVVRYFEANRLLPATVLSGYVPAAAAEGVGCWNIEYNFIVSAQVEPLHLKLNKEAMWLPQASPQDSLDVESNVAWQVV